MWSRIHIFAWTTWLAIALAVHFGTSIAIWVVSFMPSMTDPAFPRTFADELQTSASFAATAVGLFVLSVVALIASLRRGSRAWRIVGLAAIAAVACFCIDVWFGRWQIHVFIATTDYWEIGGPEHVYYTWWWYSDRWFR